MQKEREGHWGPCELEDHVNLKVKARNGWGGRGRGEGSFKVQNEGAIQED